MLGRGDGEALDRLPVRTTSCCEHLGEGTGDNGVADRFKELLGV